MPWPTGAAYAEKHNKKLKGEAATKAKDQAEALLKKGLPEGEAMAIANKTGDRVQARKKSRAERWYG